jgi:hypothetical protein
MIKYNVEKIFGGVSKKIRKYIAIGARRLGTC